MMYTLVTMNPSKNEYWQVHKHNCKDVLKLKSQGMVVSAIEAESPEALIERELNLNEGEFIEMGYDADCFRVMPCVKERK